MTEEKPGRIPVGRPVGLRFDHETKRSLDLMAAQFGRRRVGAVLRVAARRLVAQPEGIGNALAEQRRLSRDRTPAVYHVRINVHLDEDLLDTLDTIGARVGADRVELMRLAVKRVLSDPGMLEEAVNREIFRSEKNKTQLLRRHARLQERRRTQLD
ncbi:ribbon-helix-helix protein, CopG family [Rhodococcus marinonascens]|uniref:ribbon-helix-helix protein, CopG family n=1 Tax=Rhodococcus marinonascens TaxID=38311 RepID=UPI000934FEEE|nr:ribbon-helix-helix protein, CopG family [Rhodococcus marinonascens]